MSFYHQICVRATLQVIYHQLHPNVAPSSHPQNRGEPREEEQKTASRRDAQGAENGQKPPPPEPPFLVGCLFTSTDDGSGASQRNFMQADVLDGRPNYGQATGFCGEHVNLIGTLPHIAEQTQSAHWWSEYADACSQGTRKKSAGVLHPQPSEAPPRDSACCIWRVFAVSWTTASCFVGCSQMPTSSAWTAPRSRRGIALRTLRCLCDLPALTRGSRKQFLHGCEQSVMTVAHDQINLGGSPCAQVLQEADPAIFVLLCTGDASLTPLCSRSDPRLMRSR
jgi:hypothetical protein